MLYPNAVRIRAAILMASASILTACADDGPTQIDNPSNELPAAETRPIAAPILPRLNSTAPMLATCGTTKTYPMTDGNHEIGRITVANDGDNLYVTYEVTSEHWFISDTRLAVARTRGSVPRDDNGDPSPWAFPYFGEHSPVVTSFTYVLPLAELNLAPGSDAVISAMAGVVHPTTSSYEGPWEWLVMWGVDQGGSFETVHDVKLEACGSNPPPPPTTGGVITLTFDDGWLTTYTNVFPILRELGLQGNIAINPQPIDEHWTGYLTLPQVQEMHAAGWSVVSHSVTHRDLTSLSASELEAELVTSKQWIDNHGFNGSNVFVVPFHSWGARERERIMAHYDIARGYTVNQFWPAQFSDYPIDAPYDIKGYEPEYAPWRTAEGRARTMEYVERAVVEGEILDLFFHQVTDADEASFRQLMEQIAARYQANVRTWAEVAP